MKIIKYKKATGNTYKVVTNKGEYKLYDDVIIKHELLLKKEITEKAWEKVLKENSNLSSYYACLKSIETKLRTEKELRNILNKKKFNQDEIAYAIKRIKEEGYLNNKVYIEAYIHDKLALDVVGEKKLVKDLEQLGFKTEDVFPYIEKIDKDIYIEKIKKYVDKKAKVNKKSINEFKRKTMTELINRGFNKIDIESYLDTLDLEEDLEVLERLVLKLYQKYCGKNDDATTILKIKKYLYSKGYTLVNVEEIIKKGSN